MFFMRWLPSACVTAIGAHQSNSSQAVQRGMTRRLQADPLYANRLAKNPLHPKWRSSWIVGQPFDLLTLLEPLDPTDTRHYPQRSELAGTAVTAISSTSFVPSPTATCLPTKKWATSMYGVTACLRKRAPSTSLRCHSVKAIFVPAAKSIADWTWRRFSKEAYSAKQRSRAQRGRAVTGNTTAALIADAIQDLGHPTDEPFFSRRGISAGAVALHTGKSTRTVRRYATEPRRIRLRSRQARSFGKLKASVAPPGIAASGKRRCVCTSSYRHVLCLVSAA